MQVNVTGPKDSHRGVNGSLDDQDLKAAVERALTIDEIQL